MHFITSKSAITSSQWETNPPTASHLHRVNRWLIVDANFTAGTKILARQKANSWLRGAGEAHSTAANANSITKRWTKAANFAGGKFSSTIDNFFLIKHASSLPSSTRVSRESSEHEIATKFNPQANNRHKHKHDPASWCWNFQWKNLNGQCLNTHRFQTSMWRSRSSLQRERFNENCRVGALKDEEVNDIHRRAAWRN